MSLLFLCSGAAAAQSNNTQEGFGFSGIAAGAKISTVLGDNYQSYTQPVGFEAQLWANEPSLLGKVFQLHGVVSYVPYKLKGVTDYSLNQWSFLAGIETGRNGNPNWIKPYVSLDIGVAYSRLGLPANAGAVAATVADSSGMFAGQLCSGVEIPVVGQFSALLAAPLKVIFSTNKMISLDGEFSLRWAL